MLNEKGNGFYNIMARRSAQNLTITEDEIKFLLVYLNYIQKRLSFISEHTSFKPSVKKSLKRKESFLGERLKEAQKLKTIEKSEIKYYSKIMNKNEEIISAAEEVAYSENPNFHVLNSGIQR